MVPSARALETMVGIASLEGEFFLNSQTTFESYPSSSVETLLCVAPQLAQKNFQKHSKNNDTLFSESSKTSKSSCELDELSEFSWGVATIY